MSKSNITKEDSFGSSCSPKILRSDSSFEIIDEDSLSLKMTFNSLTPLRTSVLNPLQDAIEQNKDLKELLEKCENKMSSVRKDQDLMLQKLEEEKKRCNILEEETLRLQLNITSLNQKLAEVSKERDDAIKDLLPTSPKVVTNDHEFIVENNKERIRLDAMRQAKMEKLVKNLSETKKQLEDCQKHLQSKDNDLLAAHKKIETMRTQLSLVEETLAEEREKKMEKENELNSMKRTVTQLSTKLKQEESTYSEGIKVLNDSHNGELCNLRADYNKRIDGLQQLNKKLQQQVDVLRQELSKKDKDAQDNTSALEAAHRKEVNDLTGANTKINRELVALKVLVQDKETTLSQLERERNSLKESVELMRVQIHAYDSDFGAERQSREQIAAENRQFKQKIEEMKAEFQRIRDDFTTERTAHESVATENERLKQEVHEEKQSYATLRRQVVDKDAELQQLSASLLAMRNEKEQLAYQVTLLTQQIDELQQTGSHVPPSQQGGHLPPLQQAGHVPPLQQGGHIPPLQQAGHVPPLQQGGHVPPFQQAGHNRLPLHHAQGVGQSGNPHRLTNASDDILRANAPYTPPRQHPIPPEQRNPPRQGDDATGDLRNSTNVRYPPTFTPFVCPICQRTDFDELRALETHAAYCHGGQ